LHFIYISYIQVSKSININANVSFIDKSKWTEDLTCYVCSRVFSKMDMIFTHHWFLLLKFFIDNDIVVYVEDQYVGIVVQRR